MSEENGEGPLGRAGIDRTKLCAEGSDILEGGPICEGQSVFQLLSFHLDNCAECEVVLPEREDDQIVEAQSATTA